MYGFGKAQEVLTMTRRNNQYKYGTSLQSIAAALMHGEDKTTENIFKKMVA